MAQQRKAFSKVIGIIGGAGPMASAFLYQTIIETCQKKYGSVDYNEFPEIILESFPFTRGDAEKIEREISHCIQKLKQAGANLFAIASNSFHGFLPDLSSIEFVNLIFESLEEASNQNISTALVLSSQSTIDLKLFEQRELQCIYPSLEDQQRVQELIREVARGDVSVGQANALVEIIERTQSNKRFDGIILACTELPVICCKFPIREKILTPIIDTVEILTNKLLTSS